MLMALEKQTRWVASTSTTMITSTSTSTSTFAFTRGVQATRLEEKFKSLIIDLNAYNQPACPLH